MEQRQALDGLTAQLHTETGGKHRYRYPLSVRSPAQLMELEGITLAEVKRAQASLLATGSLFPSVPLGAPGEPATANGNLRLHAKPSENGGSARNQEVVSSRLDDDEAANDDTILVGAGSANGAVGIRGVDSLQSMPRRLDDMSTAQLKLLCAERTLQRTGTKRELLQRLERFASEIEQQRGSTGTGNIAGGEPSDGGDGGGASNGRGRCILRRVDYRTYLQSGNGPPQTTKHRNNNSTAAVALPDGPSACSGTIAIDTRERKVQDSDWEDHLAQAGHQGQTVRTTLPIGDFAFADPQTGHMLPAIVERKRLDDLASSIKDTRYQEQKRTLARCGLRPVVYLLEGQPSKYLNNDPSVRQRCETAALSCMFVDEFHVAWMYGGASDTGSLLSQFGKCLHQRKRVQEAKGGTVAVDHPTLNQWEKDVTAIRDHDELESILPRMLSVIRGCSSSVALFLASALGQLTPANVQRVKRDIEAVQAEIAASKKKPSRKRGRQGDVTAGGGGGGRTGTEPLVGSSSQSFGITSSSFSQADLRPGDPLDGEEQREGMESLAATEELHLSPHQRILSLSTKERNAAHSVLCQLELMMPGAAGQGSRGVALEATALGAGRPPL